jgi:excisionase family DNA binding protein
MGAQAEIEHLADEYVRELHDERLSYKPAEAARLLGVDQRTVRRLVAAGKLAAIRPSSGLTLISRQALYDFLGVTDDHSNVAKATVEP